VLRAVLRGSAGAYDFPRPLYIRQFGDETFKRRNQNQHTTLGISPRQHLFPCPEWRSLRYLERRWSSAYVARMRVLVLRRLLIFLTGLAFLVGAGAQAMPSARFMEPTPAGAGQIVMGMDCATMAMNGDATLVPKKQAPCKGISLDCATQLGCILSPALPALSTALGFPIAYGRLSYWPHLTTALAGLSIKPNLHPPIAA
jgi:hypothetical protein